ncbi:antitoxin VapB family protein [Halobium palmae]|uniref:Antitoxin VapB family protein n=1 Tax=Halobium palmae TaxID=1776492 RepID=A0ABD5RXV2_9EURY
MGSTTIRVSKRTRDFLERRKREGESFDDVIARLLDDDSDAMSGFGAWKESGIGEAVEEVREEMETDYDRRETDLFEERSDT